MSVDAQKLQDVPGYMHMTWAGPMNIAIALYFLWLQLGPAVLAGLAILLLMIPVNVLLGKKIHSLQVKMCMILLYKQIILDLVYSRITNMPIYF